MSLQPTSTDSDMKHFLELSVFCFCLCVFFFLKVINQWSSAEIAMMASLIMWLNNYKYIYIYECMYNCRIEWNVTVKYNLWFAKVGDLPNHLNKVASLSHSAIAILVFLQPQSGHCLTWGFFSWQKYDALKKKSSRHYLNQLICCLMGSRKNQTKFCIHLLMTIPTTLDIQ